MSQKTKILLALDLSSEEPREVRFAADLARAFDAEVILCHVIGYAPSLPPYELPSGAPVPQMEIMRELAAQRLTRIGQTMALPDVRSVIETGGAAERIVDVARRERVDQIVIGSHRQNAAFRLLLGSVADRVSHTAPCPVTIVREMTR